jgi:hypothetical protein
MPRILMLDCKQENSSFNPLPSEYECFSMLRGPAMLDHRALNSEISGALSVFDGCSDVEVIPPSRRGRAARAFSRRRA